MSYKFKGPQISDGFRLINLIKLISIVEQRTLNFDSLIHS